MATELRYHGVDPVSFHIAVFCKAPIEGRVKTRLIPALGSAQATMVYRQLVQRTLNTVQSARQACQASASLWVADEPEHSDVDGWSTAFNLPLYQQQGGDLGARMLHCLQSLTGQHQKVLLIGTDCPILQASDLQAAAATLGRENPWVFTPAEDGGYVLVGSCAPTPTPFTGIRWSTDAVMAQTRTALATANAAWSEMPTLWDVDEPADVSRAVALELIRL